MAKYKKDWKREADRLQIENNTIKKQMKSATRVINLANELFYLIVDAKTTITQKKISISLDQNSMQNALEADMVSLQTELESYTDEDIAPAEQLIDDVEADAVTYNDDQAVDIDNMTDAIDEILTVWFGSSARRGSNPR
jgi:hypothetical protein